MIKQYLISLTFGLFGVLVGLVIWHSYADHVLLHNVVNALTASASQQRANQPQVQSK